MDRSAGSEIISRELPTQRDQAILVTSPVSFWRIAPDQIQCFNETRSEGLSGVPDPATPDFLATTSAMVRPLGLEPRTL